MTSLRSLMNAQTDQAGRFWSVLDTWWRGLDDNRGARAALRRAKTPQEVFISPAFQRGPVALLGREGITLNLQDQERLALGLGVLVHVEPPVQGAPGQPLHFARLLAPKDKSQESTRDPRMRKLLTLEDHEAEALFLMLRRLAKYLEGNSGDGPRVGASWRDLIKGACLWNDKTRRDWAMDYYVHREKPGK